MVRIPINQNTEQNDAEQQEGIHYATATSPSMHPVSEVGAPAPGRDTTGEDSTGEDSTGTYNRGARGGGDASVTATAQTSDMQGQSHSGPVGREVAGASGPSIAPAESTPHLDAGDALENVTQDRLDNEAMQEAQAAGEVAQQRVDVKPGASNPSEGTPPNATGSESSANAGGSDSDGVNGADGQANASDGGAGASSQAQSRAAAEGDDRFLALAADFENYKRAVARRETEVRERAEKNVLEDLLPVLDNFERALQAAQTMPDSPGVNTLRAGIQGILMQMQGVLRAYNIEPIEAKGQHFDPLKHEALEEVAANGQAPGTIVDEAQRGYLYRGQVLRPSRVRVAG